MSEFELSPTMLEDFRKLVLSEGDATLTDEARQARERLRRAFEKAEADAKLRAETETLARLYLNAAHPTMKSYVIHEHMHVGMRAVLSHLETKNSIESMLYSRRTMRAANAEAWEEGFEAAATWRKNNPGPSGIPLDPPLNPYSENPFAQPSPSESSPLICVRERNDK